ncbi:Possible lipoprotein [Yersinia phage fHe-Yen9-04]|uniref:Possible lipoprotein n=1 Tax=Yersinia phage fHe-Yen9-04 TaxID=2052742 RepID=A0A2C9CY65_9CAUD|nr:Possible lipoprotein [Yersinia phage fHe-Yen9-04]SOK58803.1 Possible lipoprotein [Yersinia phage fHe-Yen9-04]VUE36572.1 Possible lipoprotein [Yersinia phage fHe-Yen9-04]
MKRTKNINCSRFRKVHSFWKYSALFVAIGSTFFLTACDVQEENVSVYSTIQACENNATNITDKNRCALDYQNALSESEKVSPKYNTKDSCEEEFGTSQCTQKSTNTSSGIMWFPIMSGFSSSNANYSSQPLYSSSRYSSAMHNKFVDANGNSFGDYKNSGKVSVSKSSLEPKRTVTNTITRAGFGSTVKAKASSVSHSSSSRSFGG